MANRNGSKGQLPTSNPQSNDPQGATSASSSSSTTTTTSSGPSDVRRATSTALPGISTTASSLRAARKTSGTGTGTGSSSSSTTGYAVPDDELGFEEGPGDTQRALDELKGGISMPGMGARGIPAGQKQAAAGGRVGAATSTSSTAAAGGNSAGPAPSGTGQVSGGGGAAATGAQGARGNASGARGGASSPSQLPGVIPEAVRNRMPTTLKSAMKKPAPLIRRATTGSGGGAASAAQSASASGRPGASGGAQPSQSRYKGTPARSIRYSLPVRAEKPVRTTKISGKHVVLPSESQLAPFPEDEDDDDDDDDDSDESSSDEAGQADDEDPEQVVEREGLDAEAAERERQARQERREAAQKAAEDKRERKAALKAAKKPAVPPGYGAQDPKFASAVSGGAYRGPAYARAPPRVPKASGPAYHTFERLAPSARVHTSLPRLTSYAIGNDLHIPTLNGFLRREHGVRPRTYDECAYVVYFKPLLPGFGRANLRSSPEPRSGSPGAESRRERELEEREERGYIGSYFAANKDENDESMDPQGYIQGGEGSGSGEGEDRRRREEREREHRYGGETTEVETEAETETETEREKRVAADAFDMDAEMRGTRDAIAEESENDEVAATPRALQPRRSIDAGDKVATEMAPLELDKASSPGSDDSSGRQTPVTIDGVLGTTSADAEGAMDMLKNQEEEAGGVVIDGEGSLERSGSPVREVVDVIVPEGSEDQTQRGGLTSQDQQAQARRRRPRKSHKMSGPNQASHNHDTSANMLTSRGNLEALQVAELVILPYGIIVFFNFSAAEERDIVDDVLSSGCVRGTLNQDDREMEAFHFCYDPTVPNPRIFNDFFTFRAPNHLLKLSLAHAIAQSTKLSVFEESMQRTLELTSHIPKELASSGELRLKRNEALRLTGRLFKLRVDVNLTSNVLDTPELFWSEATLQALYDAIREYLEIDQRVSNLNDRLKVANDLLEIIHGHVAEEAMSKITVVIIALIVVACIVALGEVTARLVVAHRDRVEEGAKSGFAAGAKYLFSAAASRGEQGAAAAGAGVAGPAVDFAFN